jgi:hypothetical protein
MRSPTLPRGQRPWRTPLNWSPTSRTAVPGSCWPGRRSADDCARTCTTASGRPSPGRPTSSTPWPGGWTRPAWRTPPTGHGRCVIASGRRSPTCATSCTGCALRSWTRWACPRRCAASWTATTYPSALRRLPSSTVCRPRSRWPPTPSPRRRWPTRSGTARPASCGCGR